VTVYERVRLGLGIQHPLGFDRAALRVAHEVPTGRVVAGRVPGGGCGHVVAEVAQVVGAESAAVFGCKAEVSAKVIGNGVEIAVGVPRAGSLSDVDVEVGGGGVEGVFEVDEDTVAGRQSLGMVESKIGGELGALPQLVDVLWVDGSVDGDVGFDADDRDRAAGSVGVASDLVGVRGGWIVSSHRSGCPAVGRLVAVPLADLPDLPGLLLFVG
jgi:hypothetical protein